MSRNFKHLILVAMLSSIATYAAADDSVPVYDADNYSSGYDSVSDMGSAVPQAQPDQTFNPSSTHAAKDLTSPKTDIQVQQRLESAAKVESLQSEVQSLRGQVEQLTHQLQQVQTQQRTMYSDLEKRVALASKAPVKTELAEANEPPVSLKSTPDDTIAPKKTSLPSKVSSKPADAPSASATVTTPVATKANSPQPNVAEEQQIYQTAYNLIKGRKYNEAVAALQKMLQKYPSGQFAANAHYWLGELYGIMGNNDQSATEFAAVVKNYPDSPKVSDAQLKLGLIYAAAFKWSDAKLAFKKIINRYPGTASARLAAEQLKQIKDSGH